MTYEWYVVAFDDNGGESETTPWAFTISSPGDINYPPGPFSLLSPAPESLIESTSVNFEWEESVDDDPNGQIVYRLEIHTDSSLIIYETDQPNWIVDNMNDNTTYEWNVFAIDNFGLETENTAGPQLFTINVENEAPSVVSLITPTLNSIETDLTPLFYWSESFDPDPFDHLSYQLFIDLDSLFVDTEIVSIDSNTYHLNQDLNDNSEYFWKVQTIDMTGEVSETEHFNFFTDAFPEPPSNFSTVYPENNEAGIGTQITFSWNRSSDPDPLDRIHYQVIYATNWDDSSTYIYSDAVEDTFLTIELEDNSQYFWKVLASDLDNFSIGSNDDQYSSFTVGTLLIDSELIPVNFALHQNYPNPFNPSTQIKFDLPKDIMVSLTIFDLMGRKIKSLVNSVRPAGFQSVSWDATNDYGERVSAGIYIYTIQAEDYRATKKMILLK